MLNISVKTHRDFLPAKASGQKLFAMMKVRPTKEVSLTKPKTSFVFVIDTSGSMTEMSGTKSKIEIVVESLLTLVRSGTLGADDYISIIQFDSSASILIDLTSADNVVELESAIAKLKDFSGGTLLGLGLQQALSVLEKENMVSCRAFMFTDGQTSDEDKCRELAQQFQKNNIPITSLGVGNFNEDLLINLSDITAGRCFHVIEDAKQSGNNTVLIEKLPAVLADEFGQAQGDVITNLSIAVSTVKGVKLSRVLRAYPDQADFPVSADGTAALGNATSNDETVFILDFDVDERPPAKARVAQFGLTYDVPGQNRRGEVDPQSLIVQFVEGQAGAAQVDPEVMGYMQQCNIAQIVSQATREENPEKAEQLLETARRMTVRLGNTELADSLTTAQEELRKTRKISAGTRKTVKIGSKGKTVKMVDDINEDLSEEQIRHMSGT